MKSFDRLVDIMAALRSDGGCPWDREQTHKSIRNSLIEESYEFLDAVDSEDALHMKEELGDVLLQVIFHSRIKEEEGSFTVDDVCHGICEKLIRRHPHVFAEEDLKTPEEVLVNWEKIKRKEKKNSNQKFLLDGIPSSIPALLKAHMVQSRVARVGFDWEHIENAMEKLDEELAEFQEACLSDKEDRVAEELGDILFSIVNVARFLDVDPEDALSKTTGRFISRFRYIEEKAAASGRTIDQLSFDQMNVYWEEAKG